MQRGASLSGCPADTTVRLGANVSDPDAILLAVRDTLGDPDARVAVGRDPYRGVRIVIVSAELRDLNATHRHNKVRPALANLDVSSLKLLAPEEADPDDLEPKAVTGTLPDLPLWPERLAIGQADEIEVTLPSHSLSQLAPPVVATFYSLRGGVGRSTALAHTARILARDHRVICVDMDLEAPGLASLLDVEDQVGVDQGVLPLLLQAEVLGDEPKVDEHLIRIGERDLYLLPAGLPSADYARRLAQLDPAAWYREEVNPLRLLMAGLRGSLTRPQVVLVDSRTGISPLSAPLLFELADVAIVAFFPHPQARLGTQALTRALIGAKTRRQVADSPPFTPEPRFIISPVPGAEELRTRFEDRAISWLQEWLAPARTESGEKPFDAIEELVQVVPYSEDAATSDSIPEGSESTYGAVAGWIASFVATSPGNTGQPVIPNKPAVLADLHFSTGTAEDQSDDEFSQTFLQTDVIARALQPDVPLVIGRKGTGKTALFRRLSQEPGSVVVTSPAGLRTHQGWMPESETYAAIDRGISASETEWRSVWPCLIAIVLQLSGRQVAPPAWVDTPLNSASSSPETYRSSMLVEDIRTLLKVPDAAVLVWDWLQQIDASLTEPVLLLFDGLDTGFGLNQERRSAAISGLLAFFLSRGEQLRSLDFKVMLRDDIWRDVAFPNKSHLYGRQVRLAWAVQADYLRVAIKQAARSPLFWTSLEQALQRKRIVGPNLRALDVAYWPTPLVYEAWTWLAGERVSGGKTAFTYNWVWNRLSDANDDHSPRALLQLLNEALSVERRLDRAGVYERSIIRPRALVESLDSVSEQAFDALREEFLELAPVFNELERIGRTPFDAGEFLVDAGLETLAREVGLLGIELGKRDDVERYRVPELYRKALHMTRRGQA